VDKGALDVALGQLSPPPEQIRRYASDPELRKRLFAHVGNSVRYVNLNVAVPPFDDLHVRKAANLAIDKQALRRAARGGLGGRIAGHIAPDAFLNNLLLDYDPYETPGQRGDVNAARAEMRKSRYDRNRDGRCDAPACRGLVAPVRVDDPTNVELGRLVRDDLRAIGIELEINSLDPETYFETAVQPRAKAPVVPSLGWGIDFLNGAGIFPPLFSGALVGHPSSNLSLVGASPAQLKRLGYPPRKVPSIDAKIGECLRLTARAQTQCWAETDQLLMERIVPWVPYVFEGSAKVVSSRVARFTFSQASFALMPAFDQIALKQGSS
jgi:peptide/nickel transport system substrate-binding protein